MEEIKSFLTKWSPLKHFGPHSILLVVGGSGSGKTYSIHRAINDLGRGMQEIQFIHQPSEVVGILYDFATKVSGYSDHLKQDTVFVLDDLDTLIAIERAFTGKLLKFIQDSRVPDICLITVCTKIGERKLGSLKGVLKNRVYIQSPTYKELAGYLKGMVLDKDIIVKANGSYTRAKELTLAGIGDIASSHSSCFTAHDVFEKIDREVTWKYITQDPWLCPLGLWEDIPNVFGTQARLETLSRGIHCMLSWARMLSDDTDEENYTIPSCYVGLMITSLIPIRRKPEKAGAFSRLLTEHSMRKKHWSERFHSGLPWNQDLYGCLGSKFSLDTLRESIYGR